MNRRLVSASIGGTFALAALLAAPVFRPMPAAAQTQDGPVQPSPAEPRKTIPEKIAPPDQAIPEPAPGASGAVPGEPLGKTLDRTDGVLTPPGNVDPNIHVPAPAPDAGTMPVIPPPGSPGNPSPVQPK